MTYNEVRIKHYPTLLECTIDHLGMVGKEVTMIRRPSEKHTLTAYRYRFNRWLTGGWGVGCDLMLKHAVINAQASRDMLQHAVIDIGDNYIKSSSVRTKLQREWWGLRGLRDNITTEVFGHDAIGIPYSRDPKWGKELNLVIECLEDPSAMVLLNAWAGFLRADATLRAVILSLKPLGAAE